MGNKTGGHGHWRGQVNDWIPGRKGNRERNIWQSDWRVLFDLWEREARREISQRCSLAREGEAGRWREKMKGVSDVSPFKVSSLLSPAGRRYEGKEFPTCCRCLQTMQTFTEWRRIHRVSLMMGRDEPGYKAVWSNSVFNSQTTRQF